MKRSRFYVAQNKEINTQYKPTAAYVLAQFSGSWFCVSGLTDHV